MGSPICWKLTFPVRLCRNDCLWWVRKSHADAGDWPWVAGTWLIGLHMILGLTDLSSWLWVMGDAQLLWSYRMALVSWAHGHPACQMVPVSLVCGCGGLPVPLGLASSHMVYMDSWMCLQSEGMMEQGRASENVCQGFLFRLAELMFLPAREISQAPSHDSMRTEFYRPSPFLSTPGRTQS